MKPTTSKSVWLSSPLSSYQIEPSLRSMTAQSPPPMSEKIKNLFSSVGSFPRYRVATGSFIRCRLSQVFFASVVSNTGKSLNEFKDRPFVIRRSSRSVDGNVPIALSASVNCSSRTPCRVLAPYVDFHRSIVCHIGVVTRATLPAEVTRVSPCLACRSSER